MNPNSAQRVRKISKPIGRAWFFNIAATLIFCITTHAETPSSNTSGIEGTIVVSPSRPGPIFKDEGPTVAPVSNSQFAVKAGDAVIKRFTTDNDGHFQIALPPGHYLVLREGAAPGVGRWSFEADVVAGRMTSVKWTADSGMR